MDVLIVALYSALFALLSVHGLHRLVQVSCVLWPSGPKPQESEGAPTSRAVGPPLQRLSIPLTVQLPIYNERHVAERLVAACAALRWPRDQLEIQVLDDSTDETSELLAAQIHELRSTGLDIRHIQRKDRKGYKAGALADGLRGTEEHPPARGELIAIFDADFAPESDFLQRCAPALLAAPDIAAVQARWTHLNREHSLLTRAQAIFLDAHFAVEHAARQRIGNFLNFNGTAGIWRRSAIEVAGGWSHDTITEDLDLSYRAQLNGLRFVYLHDVEAPAELPPEMNAFKSQQHRWAKGSIECARKLLPLLWWRDDIREHTRVEAALHLLANLGYPLVLLLSVLALPITWIATEGRMSWPHWYEGYVFGVGLLPVLVFFALGQRRVGRSLRQTLPMLIPAVALGIGISTNQSLAVLGGALGRRSPFVRTPKYRVQGRGGSWLGAGYLARRGWLPLLELALAAACAWAAALATTHGAITLGVFLTLFAWGHGWVATASAAPRLFEVLRARREPRRKTGDSSSPESLRSARSPS
jgi:cellulose synthase/poly-beta-1,6-N-acetylglucosamine synthase-like glycosyltransferase